MGSYLFKGTKTVYLYIMSNVCAIPGKRKHESHAAMMSQNQITEKLPITMALSKKVFTIQRWLLTWVLANLNRRLKFS